MQEHYTIASNENAEDKQPCHNYGRVFTKIIPLLPPELMPSKKAPKSTEAEPQSVEAMLLGSLGSKPSVTTSAATTTNETAALDFGIFESDLSTESKKKDVKKQLTGLEVLEEEFSARVNAKVASATSPLSIQPPLVPENAPLDDFGDFEAYSSSGVDGKKTSVLLLTGVSATGEPSPTLKKKVSMLYTNHAIIESVDSIIIIAQVNIKINKKFN